MRKQVTIAIEDTGRDQGKVFVLTEMSAYQAEKWAMRAILALAKAGVDLPDKDAGMAAIATAGFKALAQLDFDVAEPLLDEMFTCVQIKPSANVPPRDLVVDDIEEVATRIKLRMEVFKLHVNFFIDGAT